MNCLNTIGSGINNANTQSILVASSTATTTDAFSTFTTMAGINLLKSFNNIMYCVNGDSATYYSIRDLNNFSTTSQPMRWNAPNSISTYIVTPTNNAYVADRKKNLYKNSVRTAIATFNEIIYALYQTSTDLYIGGAFTTMNTPTLITASVIVYNFANSTFSGLPGLPGTTNYYAYINSIVMFKGKLYVSRINSGLYVWDDSNLSWSTVSTNAFITKMVADDTNLYITGTVTNTSSPFRTSCIERYDGTTWYKNYGYLYRGGIVGVNDMLLLNSILYVGGQFDQLNTDTSFRSLIALKNDTWNAMAPLGNVVGLLYSNNSMYIFTYASPKYSVFKAS